jgi:peptidoglycan/xylan/chitin deacetylase (PgdA/CDA1 family)
MDEGLFDSNKLYSNGNLIIIFSILVVGIFVIILGGQFLVTYGESVPTNGTNNKVVILNFDDNRKSQFTQAKPILDKYGFKATFYVVCKYLDNKKGYMNWTQLETLYKEGHDIGSHTMNHANLSDSSKKSLEFQIGRSKACLQEHGINATSFAYPFDKGWDNKTVVNIVSKYYELARTASSPLTFLHCDGWKDKSNQTDCRIYTKNGKLNYATKYSIRGWSHDLSRRENSYDDPALFDRFIQVVNSQSDYNKNGIIKAIPIIIYHRASDKVEDYNTDLDLFDKEMKYLHDGNFTVLTMADLGYDKKSNYLYIK